MVNTGRTGTPLVSWKLRQLRNGTLLLMLSPHHVLPSSAQPIGFTRSGLRGTEVRIDCTISDGPRYPAHVVTYAEANWGMDGTQLTSTNMTPDLWSLRLLSPVKSVLLTAAKGGAA